MRVSRFFPLACVLVSPMSFAETTSSPTVVEQVESAIVEQTNEFRKKKELDALESDAELTKSASQFAQYMAESGRYGHRADGRTPARRAKAAGYQYCVVRENIAYRTNTGEVSAENLIDVFVQGWIDSPSHRENMLADYVTQTGVAVATADDVTYYAVQLFGRPKSESIRIEIANRSGGVQTLVISAADSEEE